MILKHFLKITAAALAIAGMGFTVSCSEDGPDTPPVNYDKEVRTKGVYGYEETENGLGNFQLCFTTGTVTDGKLKGPGDVYLFDVYSKVSTTTPPTPQAGTYTLDGSNTNKEWTFAKDDSHFGKLATDSDEVQNQVDFTDGTLIITVSGKKVIAEALVTVNGEKIKLTTASFTFLEKEVETVDLERDLDLTCVRTAGGVSGDKGDYYQNNTTNFILYSYADRTGDHRLRISLVGPATPEGSIPALQEGTYTIGTEPNEFTCIAGNENVSAPLGTWYENQKTGEVGWLTNGTVKITAAKGMVYTIEVDATTNLGHSVKSSYVGGFEFNGDAAPTTLLTQDHVIDFSNVSKGKLIFFGNWDNTNMNLIVVDLDPALPNKEGLSMYLLQPNLDDILEEHLYEASNNFKITPYTFIPGQVNGTISFEPTTFYIYDAQAKGTVVQAPIHAGTIQITQEGANWNFEIDAYDDANYHITGSWTGPLEVTKQ